MDQFMNAEISDNDLILQWLNSAAITPVPSEKLETLHKLKEFLLHKTPHLLTEFIPNILNFTTDRNADVKKALVGFIEEACKQNETLLTEVMVSLHMLLCDESVAVQKRVMQAAITIYRRMLSWVCRAASVTTQMEQSWTQLTVIKGEILNMVDSDNDGVRTSAVKFLECVVLLQTYPESSDSRVANDFSLEDVPLTLKIARRRKLEEEANKIFEVLMKFTGSQHISSANLFACIGALMNIAKHRPEFMGRVVSGIELLSTNMPPTLSSTQVNSIRKKLKTELCALIKHHSATDYIENITTMLVDLGYTHSEVQKMIPKSELRNRFNKRHLLEEGGAGHASKRPKIEKNDAETERQQKRANEINEKYVREHLNIDKSVQLVLDTLSKLPEALPTQFKIDYTAFMKMGHVGEFKVLAKMLAIQLLEAGLGPGADYLKNVNSKEVIVEDIEGGGEKEKEIEVEESREKEKNQKKERMKVPRIRTLKLAEITMPLEKSVRERLLLGSVQRVIRSNKTVGHLLHQKVTVTMASTFNEVVRANVLSYLLQDLKSSVDLALAWLFEEYSIKQGFSRIPLLRRDNRQDQEYYNTLLMTFVATSAHDALILSRLMLEAPLLTDGAIDQLCIICKDESRCAWALGLLRDLAIQRPPKQQKLLDSILSHTTHFSDEIRERAIRHVLELYQRQGLKNSVDKFAQLYLDFLRQPQAPKKLLGEVQGRYLSDGTWTEEIVKACLQLYIGILPLNQGLIHNLSKVYVQTNADVKRAILRMIKPAINTMGMDSADLLQVIEECPKGAETLITRVIHILTDKGAPSLKLVDKVRELYRTKVSDVRFLIPVLTGLTKQEIISALPKLIKLNPVVIREVFNRLLGLHGESPITPTELLVALHLIDPAKADLKATMKATSMCLNEKQVFTQEVLAVVLQQLMDQPSLPTLLMRTVIQALGSYPRLSGFVMNILQRLILKQVWKQKVVWEGFIKCCQRTQPQSFSVLMQLPAPQLAEALNICVDLREPLRQYLATFTEGQKAHIPSSIQETLLAPVAAVPPPVPEIVPAPVDAMAPVMDPLEPLPPGMD